MRRRVAPLGAPSAHRAAVAAAVPLALAGLLALLGPGAAAGQAGTAAPGDPPAPVSAVAADTIRVGDVVPVAVRLVVDRGERVAWPDTLPLSGETAETATRVRERVDTLADGRLERTAVYGVTPWRTGTVELGEVALPVLDGREVVRTVTASLPALEVASVLPDDTTGIQPRPARGVIGASWSWWRVLLLVLLLAALVAVGVWWLRRRGRGAVAELLEPPVPPRERVLARLQEAREAGFLDRGDMKGFYSSVSAALREYLEQLEGQWSDDLTTTELLARLRRQAGPEPAAALGRVLRPADQVKFARRRPDRSTALAEWEAARAWVLEFHWPPRRAVDEAGEAA